MSTLLHDLARCGTVREVIVTQNIPETEIVFPQSSQLQLRVLRNDFPKGFAANHNQAFQRSATDLFAVLNPDISVPSSLWPGFIIK